MTFGGITMKPRMNSYKFTKLLDGGVITSTSAADGLYASSFALSNLSEVASFTSIFDQYRICWVELELTAVTQPVTTDTSTPGYSFCAVCVDLDDAATLASFSLALNYSNVALLPPGRGLRKRIAPHVNAEANSSSAAVSLKSPWLDCEDTTVPHYGFKFAVKQSSTTNVSSWYRWFTVCFEFRGVR